LRPAAFALKKSSSSGRPAQFAPFFKKSVQNAEIGQIPSKIVV
jgi:hypothetical protein